MDEYSTNSNDDLFLSLIVGLFFCEIAVGAIQVLGALIRTIIFINSKQPIGKLKIYWITVGIYFLVFAGLYYSRDILSASLFNNNAWSHEYWKWHMILLYIHIVWVFLAWGIAIWYCIKIVFVKRKSTIEINHSLTQNI